MSGKFMNIKKFTIPTITLAIIASQLMGCAAVSQSELLQMINNAEEIEIEIATPINQEQGTEQQLDWIQLDQLKTYPELRKAMDDIFKIISVGDTKNGVFYVDLEGNQNGNNTLYNAFMNSKFRDYWEDEITLAKVAEETLNTYVDIEFDGNNPYQAVYAALNAYFNLLADADPGYNNPNSTLTRLEAMAALFKAENPVTDSLSIDKEFNQAVDSSNKNPNTIYASNMSEVSYLDIESSSLDNMTANGTITRGEFIYMLVQQHFKSEYDAVDPETKCFDDAVNGGDIATEQKFIENNTPKKHWQSYELTYALQNPDHGVPERLYKALVVAHDKGILTDTDSRWDEGLTKNDFFELLTNGYQALPTITNTERGLTEALEVPEEADPNAVIEEAATLEGEYDERIHGEFAEPEVKEEQLTKAEEEAYQALKDAGVDLSTYTEQELAIILDILEKQEPINPNKHTPVDDSDMVKEWNDEYTDPDSFGSTDASQFAGRGRME